MGGNPVTEQAKLQGLSDNGGRGGGTGSLDIDTVITAAGCKTGVFSTAKQSGADGSCASSVVMVGMKAVSGSGFLGLQTRPRKR